MDHARRLDSAIEDLPTARALIATLQEQLTTSQREIASLRHQLDVLCQRLFGKKSEKVDPRQLQLALAQLSNEPGPVSEPVEMDSGCANASRSTSRTPTSSARAGTARRGSANRSRRNWSINRRVSS